MLVGEVVAAGMASEVYTSAVQQTETADGASQFKAVHNDNGAKEGSARRWIRSSRERWPSSRPTPHKRTVLYEWAYEAFVCGEPAGDVENGRRFAQEADSLGCMHCN